MDRWLAQDRTGDRKGGDLVSAVIQTFMSNQGIKQRLHISCHPLRSGVVDRMKQTIKNKKIMGQYQSNRLKNYQ